MERFFLRDYMGPAFEQFGGLHLILLGITLALSVRLFVWNPGRKGKILFRYGVSALLIANEICWHAWNIAVGRWLIQEMLPLHLSSILVWTIPVMLMTRNRHLFAFTYFAGLPGTLLALLAPELGIYGFPHFRAFSFFVAHILIFIAPLYMIRIEGMRPRLKQMGAVWGILSAYAMLMMGINSLLGSNYLFVSSRPDAADVPNVLWCWPWYVMMQAFYALAAMLLLYLPFAVRSEKRRRAMCRTSVRP